ncbi:MAG: hypothetical protein ACXVJW_10390 [Acidimicrobiia bacterium]
MTGLAVAAAAPSDETTRKRRADRVGPAGIVPLAVVVVFAIFSIVQLTHVWHPIGDFALPELFIRQIPHKLPLVGVYSSTRGFSHPSPAFFYVAYLPYEILGERSSAVLAVTLLLNGSVLAFVTWLAVRRGDVGLAVAVVAAVAVAGWGSNLGSLLLPWNPFLATMTYLALIFVTWSLWLGVRWLLPAAVVLGSWSVGNHLLFAAPVVALWVIGLIGAIRSQRREAAGLRSLRAPLLVAAGVAGAFWLPTIYDGVTSGSSSNLASIWRFVTDPPHPAVASSEAVRVLMSELSLRPFWAGGTRPFTELGSPGHAVVPWMVLAVVAAVVLARRRHATVELTGIAVSAAALLVAFLTLMRVNDLTLLDWYLIPADMASISLYAFTAWSLGRSFVAWRRADRARRWDPRTTTAIATVAVVAMLVPRVASLRVPPNHARAGDAIERMIPAVQRELHGRRDVVVEAQTNLDGNVPTTFVLALSRAGDDVSITPDSEAFFGPWWARERPSDLPHLLIVATTRKPPRPGARRIVTSAPIDVGLGEPYRVTVWRLPA